MRLTVWRADLPLARPYVLSFGTLQAFGTFFVSVEVDGRTGFGEITPLPGYGSETCDSVFSALVEAGDLLADGTPLASVAKNLTLGSPFVASGLACALETALEGEQTAFGTAIAEPIPLTALCAGETPETAIASAEEAFAAGYKTVKMKIGAGDIVADIARVKAVSVEVPVGIRLDANQALDFSQAETLVGEIAGANVVLVEQPFPPSEWDAFERLAGISQVPLMLDESISGTADLERAADCGAQWVKLKLCKHPGMRATESLIARARDLGFQIVFGNGVQAGLGNHLEARIFGKTGLEAAAEINGALKIAARSGHGGLRAKDGFLHATGCDVRSIVASAEKLFSAEGPVSCSVGTKAATVVARE